MVVATRKIGLVFAALVAMLVGGNSSAGIPSLRSRPGAPFIVYLDFHADPSMTQLVDAHAWIGGEEGTARRTLTGQSGGKPEFNAENFSFITSSSQQEDIIRDIHTIVSDRLSMFDVNVTTVNMLTEDERIFPYRSDNKLRILFFKTRDYWSTPGAAMPQFGFSQTFVSSHPNSVGNGPAMHYFGLETAQQGSNTALVWCEDIFDAHGLQTLSVRLGRIACHELAHMAGYGAHNNPSSATTVRPIQENSPQPGSRFGWATHPATLFGGDTYSQKYHTTFADAFELVPDEAFVTGLTINAPYRVGIMNFHGDTDEYTVTLTPGVNYTIRLQPTLLVDGYRGAFWVHSTDTKFRLKDISDNVLTTIDPSGESSSGWSPKLSFKTSDFPAQYNYYRIEVSNAETDGANSHGELGQYDIRITSP